MLDATARVFLAQDTFTQAMTSAYRQQLTAQILEQEEERSALVEALLSRRITDSQSLWEAADLLRLPTTGPYVVVAAELPAIGKLGLPAIENKLAARDIRSAWRLLPDLHVGIVHRAGAGDARHARHADRRAPPDSRPSGSASARRSTNLAETSERAAIRPVGGHRKAVGRLAGHGVRRHPSCRRGGERARGHGENQVVSATGD